MRIRKIFFIAIVSFILLNLLASVSVADVVIGESPVKSEHLQMIRSLFADYKIKDGNVSLDNLRRVTLSGGYKDSSEVSLAFSLCQSVVGVKWVSPVTPENIKVKDWEKKLSSLFPKNKAKPAPATDNIIENGVPTKYALVVGISEFSNEKLNLKYAAKDAQELYAYLVDSKYGKFNPNNVHLLINKDATRTNIQKALDEIKEKAGYQDMVIIYFSSHGKPDYDGGHNIVTYDSVVNDTGSKKNKMATLTQTSFPARNLKDFLMDTRAKNTVVILDVCYSGKAFKNIDGFYYAGSKAIDFGEDNQGISKAAMAKSLFGSKDVVFEDDVVTTSNITKKEATKVLISASDEGEKSWESDSLKGSVFTYYFLSGLKKKSQVKDAFNYSQPNVTRKVKEEKEEDQHPQVVADKKDWNISIAEK